jgi:hypothetical protein
METQARSPSHLRRQRSIHSDDHDSEDATVTCGGSVLRGRPQVRREGDTHDAGTHFDHGAGARRPGWMAVRELYSTDATAASRTDKSDALRRIRRRPCPTASGPGKIQRGARQAPADSGVDSGALIADGLGNEPGTPEDVRILMIWNWRLRPADQSACRVGGRPRPGGADWRAASGSCRHRRRIVNGSVRLARGPRPAGKILRDRKTWMPGGGVPDLRRRWPTTRKADRRLRRARILRGQLEQRRPAHQMPCQRHSGEVARRDRRFGAKSKEVAALIGGLKDFSGRSPHDRPRRPAAGRFTHRLCSMSSRRSAHCG